MTRKLLKTLGCASLLALAHSQASAQITLLQDYKNYTSAPIGTFQGNAYREGGFSALFPIPGTNGKEFWTCSDRGLNVDCASANPAGCTPAYDKMFAIPSYAPKMHRIRVNGDSVQILQTIVIKRPNGTAATGVMNPTGFGSLATENGSTDTVLNCANFASKIAAKDTFALDCEAIAVDKNGYFWLSEENGPYIWKLDQNGVLVNRYSPYYGQPGSLSIDLPIDSAFKYRKNNRGFENMTIAPNGKIYALIQSPLLYPNATIGQATRVHRMLELNPVTGATRMFVYLNEGTVGAAGANQIRMQDWKCGDMAAINDSTFLVMEAALRGTTDIQKVFMININQATVVNSGLYGGNTVEGLVDSTGLAAQNIRAVKKTFFMDLQANGWPIALEKAEGLAIINDSTIAICNDNDFGQTCPLANGIAIPTTTLCHVFKYGLQGTNKLPNYVPLTANPAPYLSALTNGSYFKSIITSGDIAPNGYKMCGIPDGIGLFDNNNGTFTAIVNHEISYPGGAVRAHGGSGAFVSKWIINKNDLSVVSGSDLIQRVKLWNVATNSYITYNSTFQTTTTNQALSQNFSRFCSGDLPAPTAYYNPLTGKGTQERIYMNGEESGNEGRAMGHIVTGPEAGTSYELPYLGKASFENQVANPRMSDTTIVASMDDATPGQVYFYIGQKQSTGNDIEKAGLTGGNLWSVAVNGMLTEVSASIPAANTPFTMVNLGQVQNLTGATIETNSNNAGVTRFLRPEDGAWDPQHPGDFYFNTTNAFNAPSRLWHLHFTNPANITQGGTITAVLDGTEGQQMLDNMTIDNSGHITLVEDVGNNAFVGRVLRYDIASDVLTVVGTHDTTRFKPGGTNFITQDEEASGPIDAQAVLGKGMFLIDVQAHNLIAGEQVEGGQLLAYYDTSVAVANPEIDIKGNSVVIASGATTATTANYTDFGNVNTGNSLTRTFTINNTGTGPLNVRELILSGANAANFNLLNVPALPFSIAPGASQTFDIKYLATALTTSNATLHVLNNDADEDRYNFALKGNGTTPEVNITGNTIVIADGDLTAGTTNGTDFGTVNLTQSQTQAFTIENNGTGTLTVSNIAFTGLNASDFTLVNAPTFPLTISPSGAMNFTAKFTPSVAGVRNAVLNVYNDDLDEGTYDYAVRGNGRDATAVANTSAASFVKLYPNPTGDAATVAITLKKEDRITITMTNLAGQEVMQAIDKRMGIGEQQIVLNTSSLANGAYFVQISSSTQTTKVKLVVQH